MYSTHKAKSKHDAHNREQKDSYMKEKKIDYSCFEKDNAHTSTIYANSENSTRDEAGFHPNYEYGWNHHRPDITSQATCSSHGDIKDRWHNNEFNSASYSNIDSGGNFSSCQTEDLASSNIFTKEKENHSTFQHPRNSNFTSHKDVYRKNDTLHKNSDDEFQELEGDRNKSSKSSNSQNRYNTNSVKDSNCKVDAKPTDKYKEGSKESLPPNNKVKTGQQKLEENEGEKTLNDGEPSEMNKPDLLKHLRKGVKKTQRGKKRHGNKKPGNLSRENVRNVQDMACDTFGAWAWPLFVLGMIKQGLYMMLAAFPGWIAAGFSILHYVLVLGVLSVFSVMCWIGMCVKWICVSVISKATAMIADFKAFSRQRTRTYEQSEHRHTTSTRKTSKEENMEADEIITHLLSTEHPDAYSVLGVSEQATDEEIKRKYREMAKIVHPDKNPNEKSSEAFQMLQAAFELISDKEKRTAYQFESDKQKFKEDFESFIDLMAKHLKSKIMCDSCNKTHPRLLTDRLIFAARYCARCNVRHAVNEGDVWVETSHMGFKYYCYLCMDNQVYEVTEWGACQGLLINTRANTHGVYLSVKTNRPSCSPWDDLFGDSEQPAQSQQNKKKRHKNKAKGGSKNKKR